MKRTPLTWKYRLAAVLAAGFATNPAGGQDVWFHAAWPYRRAVTVPTAPPTRLEGDDIAYVTMFTCGLTKDDGSDVRVATAAGIETPSRVLMTGPGDQVIVAFALRGKGNIYYVYFGNPDAKPPEPMAVRRGVLVEVRRYGGRIVRNFEQMQKVFDSPGELLGRTFRPDIFAGYNPFGPENRIAALYTGYLVCPWSGKYIFCTSSEDASFLLVDDKLVVENGGRHGPQRQPQRQGQIELSSGLHKLTVYHACTGNGFPIIVAAWQPPGHMQIKPIPSSAFAAVLEAKPQALEERHKGVTADFIPVHAGEAFFGGIYTQRYSFKALFTERTDQPATVLWDFGDGQRSRKPSIDHVYLTPGEYAATLTVRAGGAEHKRTNRLAVSRPPDQVTSDKLDTWQQHASVVAGYDFTPLTDEALTVACQLFQRTGRAEELVRAAQTLLQRDKVDNRAMITVMSLYSRVLSASGASAKAAEVMLQASTKVDSPDVRASLLVGAGTLFLESGVDGNKAMAAFEEAIALLPSDGPSSAVRSARIGIGDVWRVRGDMEKARAAYQAAGPSPTSPPVTASILQGDMARHVEAYLRDKDFESAEDYLDRWADALPEDKLTGFWSLLRVRVYLAQERYEQAIAEVQTLLAVNEESPYAPQLLVLAAEAYTKMFQPERAAAMLKRLVEKYPESSLAAEAFKKMSAP